MYCLGLFLSWQIPSADAPDAAKSKLVAVVRTAVVNLIFFISILLQNLVTVAVNPTDDEAAQFNERVMRWTLLFKEKNPEELPGKNWIGNWFLLPLLIDW